MDDRDREREGIERALDAAWARLEEGQPAEALEVLAGIDAGVAERWIAESLARLELGDLTPARVALGRARSLGIPADEPDHLWATGQLLLHEWKLDEAHASFRRLVEVDRSPEALERLSFLEELRGDLIEAERLYAEAHRIDPEDFPEIARLEEDEFAAVVEEAIEGLPDEFQRHLEEIQLVIAPVPERAIVVPGAESDTPPDLLGLFLGASLLERSSEHPELPPRIHLYQRNLERAAVDEEELREQIRITLYHELGHFLGFDEEGVADLGLE